MSSSRRKFVDQCEWTWLEITPYSWFDIYQSSFHFPNGSEDKELSLLIYYVKDLNFNWSSWTTLSICSYEHLFHCNITSFMGYLSPLLEKTSLVLLYKNWSWVLFCCLPTMARVWLVTRDWYWASIGQNTITQSWANSIMFYDFH